MSDLLVQGPRRVPQPDPEPVHRVRKTRGAHHLTANGQCPRCRVHFVGVVDHYCRMFIEAPAVVDSWERDRRRLPSPHDS